MFQVKKIKLEFRKGKWGEAERTPADLKGGQILRFFWLRADTNSLALFSYIGMGTVLVEHQFLQSAVDLCGEKGICTLECISKWLQDDRVLQMCLFSVAVTLLFFILIQLPWIFFKPQL